VKARRVLRRFSRLTAITPMRRTIMPLILADGIRWSEEILSQP
jgi:hypothetical protein